VVILDAETGQQTRELHAAHQIVEVSYASGDDRVYVSEPDRIVAVPLDGSPPVTVVEDGTNCLVSPDGRRLAFEPARMDPAYDDGLQVRVRTLATGEEVSWNQEPSPVGGFYVAGWLDAARLALGEVGADPPGNISGSIDVTRDAPRLKRWELAWNDPEGFDWWEAAAPHTPGTFGVVAKQGTGGESPSSIRLVAAKARNEADMLVGVSTDVWHLDFDRSGEHLVFIRDARNRRRPHLLYRWHGDSKILVARDIEVAYWLD